MLCVYWGVVLVVSYDDVFLCWFDFDLIFEIDGDGRF